MGYVQANSVLTILDWAFGETINVSIALEERARIIRDLWDLVSFMWFYTSFSTLPNFEFFFAHHTVGSVLVLMPLYVSFHCQ